jgi:hypothetical protein
LIIFLTHTQTKTVAGCWLLVQSVQSFASEHLKTPLGEPVKGNKNKSNTDLWVEKFYKKVTTLPEPFPHDLVERLEEYLDVSTCFIHCTSLPFSVTVLPGPDILFFCAPFQRLEGQLVDLSSLLYDHRLVDASQNSSDILQSTIFTEQYVTLSGVKSPTSSFFVYL